MGPPQPGDVTVTFADISKAHAAFGYQPKTKIARGHSGIHGLVPKNRASIRKLMPGKRLMRQRSVRPVIERRAPISH